MVADNSDNESNDPEDRPWLLKALDLILADPAEIRAATLDLVQRYCKEYRRKEDDPWIRDKATDKIISNYSYYTAFVGATTGLTGVVPGLGTVIATVGGASADVALTMKYQIEMVEAIAVVYGHDIRNEEQKNIAFIIAGLGTIHNFAKGGAKAAGTKAFVKMLQQYLRGALLQAVKEIFKKVGITFTRKALEKAAPFGIGVFIGFGANKALTWYVGSCAVDAYKIL